MGYTGTEPIIMDKSHWCPRLFGRKQDAETALTWWLKGITTRTFYGGGMSFGFEGSEPEEKWETRMPKSDEYVTYVPRVREDMEVVATKMEFSDGIH